MKSVKIYGERNTGTNYLEKLIQKNFFVDILPGVVPVTLDRVSKKLFLEELLKDHYFRMSYKKNLGWKHKEVDPKLYDFLNKSTGILVLVKNPYSWLLSMHKRPYHFKGRVPLSFNEFIQMPWRPLKRESSRGQYKSMVDMWNEKCRAYLEIAREGRCEIIRYEELLVDYQGVLQRIKDNFSLPVKPGYPTNYTKAAKASDSSLESSYYQDYYGNEMWRKKLTDSDVSYISRALDQTLVEKLGYKVL